jgi:hypothetical protein
MSHPGDSAFRPRRFVLGQFPDTDSLLKATRQMREKGYRKLDTHTPYPVHGIAEALGLGRPKIPALVLLGAIAGACIAYSMIYYMNAVDFPINVANRPPHSPPTNIPITFELAILIGSASGFFGLFGLLGLPEPYHPVFEAESFRRASIDSFFLSLEVPEGKNPADIAVEIRNLGSIDVQIVEESER